MDPNNNIQYVCKSCIEEKKKETQIDIDTKICTRLSTLESFHVKKSFKDGDKSETMWVIIDCSGPLVDIDLKVIYGKLDNDPIVVTNVKFGDVVRVEFNEIIQILG